MAKEMRKVRTGAVVRTSMEQTAVVEMVWKQRHRLYRKQMRRVTRFYVHDPLNQCQVGDTVRIQETRPISKTKHWRLLEILHRRQVAEVQPIELETDLDAAIAGDEAAEATEEADEVTDFVGELDAGDEAEVAASVDDDPVAVAAVEDAPGMAEVESVEGDATTEVEPVEAEAAAEAGEEKDA